MNMSMFEGVGLCLDWFSTEDIFPVDYPIQQRWFFFELGTTYHEQAPMMAYLRLNELLPLVASEIPQPKRLTCQKGIVYHGYLIDTTVGMGIMRIMSARHPLRKRVYIQHFEDGTVDLEAL